MPFRLRLISKFAAAAFPLVSASAELLVMVASMAQPLRSPLQPIGPPELHSFIDALAAVSSESVELLRSLTTDPVR